MENSKIFISVFICIFLSFYDANSYETYERETSDRQQIPFITESDGKVPESTMARHFERFMKVYSTALKKSSLYMRAKPEEKFIYDEQIEDLRNLLRTKKIRNNEDAEIIEWVKELVQLSDFHLWKTMNIVLSGNLFFGYTKDENIRRRENVPLRDEL